MSELPITGKALHKVETEYHGKFGPKIGRIQKIDPMSNIDNCYKTCLLATQTAETNIPYFQGIKLCVKYLSIHPHKTVFYPYSFYDG